MMPYIGIMQGRFTSKGGFFPQSFPWHTWREEFVYCQSNGIPFIEWMLNVDRYDENPMLHQSGRNEIRRISDITKVKVNSICMNCFMANGIDRNYGKAMSILKDVAVIANELGIKTIVIPMFEDNDIYEELQMKRVLETCLEAISDTHVQIAIETSWTAEEILLCFREINDDRIGICYDVGNMAGEGHAVIPELEILKDLLKEIHIKDKNLHSESVMLGQGVAPLRAVVRFFEGWAIPFILESYFGENAIDDTVNNINYIRRLSAQ